MLKIVQTVVSKKLHEKILKIAKKEGKTIKEIVREALEEWIIWKMGMEEDTFLNSKPVDFGVETDSGKLEFLLYGGDCK